MPIVSKINAGVDASNVGPDDVVTLGVVVGILAALAALASSGTSTATTTLYLTDPRGAPVFRDGSSNPADLERWAEQRADYARSAAVRAQVAAAIEAIAQLRDPEAVSDLQRFGDLPGGGQRVLDGAAHRDGGSLPRRRSDQAVTRGRAAGPR